MKEQNGWAWICQQQRPICAVREIKRGKLKGKLQVTLCRGRNTDGTIKRGEKKIISFNSLIEFPEEVN